MSQDQRARLAAFPTDKPVDPATIGAVLADAARRLTAAGIDQPRLDARILLAHALGMPGNGLYGQEEQDIGVTVRDDFETAISRRLNREPVSRIIGSRGFWSLDLELTAAALDPRPDSETLIEAVLAHAGPRETPIRVLDLGTGTGCLLLSVLAEYPEATGLGIDISPDCVSLAIRNAAANGLAERASFQIGHWDEGLHTIFDVIMCNPPYIPTATIADLAPEVRDHEPRGALDGGPDGLDCYRELAARFPRRLAENGHIFLEIGHDQHADVTRIMAENALVTATVRQDLGGRDRCLIIRCGA